MANNKKLYIIVSATVLVIIILTAIFQNTSSPQASKIVQAIPQNAGIVFQTKNAGNLINQIKNSKAILNEIQNNEVFNDIYNQLNFIIKLYNKNEDFQDFADGRNLLVSVHQSQKFKSSNLYVSSAGKESASRLTGILKKEFPNATTDKRTYEGVEITQIAIPETPENTFFTATIDDIMLFGFSEILIQKSIRTIKNTGSIAKNTNFVKVQNLLNSSTHSVYLNYKFLPQTIYKFIKGNSQNTQFLSNFADVTGLEIKLKNNQIDLNGYTIANKKSEYLKAFKNQSPANHDILKVIPYYTSSFALINLESGEKFKEKYESYLTTSNLLKNYRKTLNTWNKQNIGTEKTTFFKSIGSEMALISYSKNSQIDNQKVILIEIRNKKNGIEFLSKYLKYNKLSTSKHNANNEEYIIYPFDEKNFFANTFGSLFDDTNIKAVCLTDEHYIFASSQSNLKNFLQNYKQVEGMQTNKFVQTFNKESNIFICGNLLKSQNTVKNFASTEAMKSINEGKKFWSKMQSGIQFIADTDPIYTNLKLKLNNKNINNLKQEWSVQLDTMPATKPFILKNHNTKEKEIAIQTKNNTLYLINNSGKILWKITINGKIISDIYQVDFYKNNKLQMLFNTSKSIYLIDRNGNNVEQYPIDFKQKATNGIAVIDYDKTKNYRIFYAAENKKVYALDKSAKKINGWVFDKTKSTVTSKVQYFSYEGKDYICFFDNNNLYITNRKGEIRVKPKANFKIAQNTKLYFEEKTATSAPRFVTTGPTGTVYFVYLDGGIKKLTTQNFSDQHYFMYKNIVGDNYPEFIYADKNTVTVYDRLKNKLFETETESNINAPMKLYDFSKNNKQIGIINKQTNQLYLMKNNGKIQTGFPLNGNTPFSINVFKGQNYFSIITGNEKGKLINYRLYQ